MRRASSCQHLPLEEPSTPRRPGRRTRGRPFRRAGARGALLLAAALALGGCSGVARLRPGADYQLKQGSPEGLVLASFTQPYQQLHWSYRSVDGRAPATEGFVMTSWVVNGEAIMADGAEVFPFTLPAGEYEFYKWSQPAQGVYTFSVQPFSLRFSVAPGQVTYIGNVRLAMAGKSIGLGFVDRRELDVPALLAKYPRVSSDQVVVRLGQRAVPGKR